MILRKLAPLNPINPFVLKSILTVVLLLLFSLNAEVSLAQKKKSQIPDTVLKTLNAKFPDVEVASWEHEGNFYEATFEFNKRFLSVLFDGTGRIIFTEEDIDPASLPEGIKTYIVKNLKGKKVREAAKIIDSAGKITYSADVAGSDYVFDAAGTLLKSPY